MSDPSGIVIRAVIALLGAALVSVIARKRHLLDRGGGIAATIIGTALVAFGGWWAGILLVTFFLTSSLLSTSSGNHPSRTWRQVVANGGPATLVAATSLIFDSPSLLVASAATIAAATSDTWATEVGRRSGAIPRSVPSLRPVPIGTSGAVSMPGTLASLIGALLIALLAALAAPLAPLPLPSIATTLIGISLAGAAGSLIDTLLGASVQARYRCHRCGLRFEDAAAHGHEHAATLESGIAWVTNDTVNITAVCIAGLIAAIIVAYCQ